MAATGRPVLVIPYAETIDNVGRRALIAWDGTREAVRAVHGALPLLDRSEAVTVIHVGAQQASLEPTPPFSRVDFQSSKTAPDSRPTRSNLAGRPLDTGSFVIARRRYVCRPHCLG